MVLFIFSTYIVLFIFNILTSTNYTKVSVEVSI